MNNSNKNKKDCKKCELDIKNFIKKEPIHIPLIPEKPINIVKKINSEKQFVATRSLKAEIHLAGIGKFCKCGCGRRIEGVIVTKNMPKGIIQYKRKAPENKVFASKACKDRYTNVGKGSHRSKSSLKCTIWLKVHYDKEPYRMIAIHMKKGIKFEIRITPSSGKLWEMLENITKYGTWSTQSNSIEIPLEIAKNYLSK